MSRTSSNLKPQASSFLQARGLHKHYHMGGQDLHVLRGVDLEAGSGEWLAILGASGSGKSTLLHLLGGLDRPEEGKVYFDGEDVFDRTGAEVDSYRNLKVGFVFQFYHLLPELTALENVTLGAMISSGVLAWPGRRGAARRRAGELLELVGLSHRARHRPMKLSGGERQRVAIARALMNKPAVLLADEPTGNLDADTGGQVLQLFRQMHAAGQTIIMVTHDQRVAAAADRRLTLEKGQIRGA